MGDIFLSDDSFLEQLEPLLKFSNYIWQVSQALGLQSSISYSAKYIVYLSPKSFDEQWNAEVIKDNFMEIFFRLKLTSLIFLNSHFKISMQIFIVS